jgi:hypothetical protein
MELHCDSLLYDDLVGSWICLEALSITFDSCNRRDHVGDCRVVDGRRGIHSSRLHEKRSCPSQYLIKAVRTTVRHAFDDILY